VLLAISIIALTDAKGLRRVRLLQSAPLTIPVNGNPSDCSDLTSDFNETVNALSNTSDFKQFEQLMNQTNQYKNALAQLEYSIIEAGAALEEILLQTLILAKIPDGAVVFSAVGDLLDNLTSRYENYTNQLIEFNNDTNIGEYNDLLLPFDEQVRVLFGFNILVQQSAFNSSQCSNLSVCIAIYDSYEALKNANLSLNVSRLEEQDYDSVVNDFINTELGPLLEVKFNFFDQLFSDYIYADLSNYNATKYANNSFRREQAAQNETNNVGGGAAGNSTLVQPQNNSNGASGANVQNGSDNTSTAPQANAGNVQNSGGRRTLQLNEGNSSTQANNNNASQVQNQTANNTQQQVRVFPGGSGHIKGVDVLKSGNAELYLQYIDFVVSFNDFIESELPSAVHNLTAIADSPLNLQFQNISVDIPLGQDPLRVNSHYISDIRQCLDDHEGYASLYQIEIDASGN